MGLPRCSTVVLHRQNPAVRETPDFKGLFRCRKSVAEREGFEPPIGLHLCRISSAVHSTTLPPLQGAPSREPKPPWSGPCSKRGRLARQGAEGQIRKIMGPSAERNPARSRHVSCRSDTPGVDRNSDGAADEIAAFFAEVGISPAGAIARFAETERCGKKPGATVPIESEWWL
jgi:hypothetical protein